MADTGKLEITGTTGITATGQTVTLDDSTNEFGGTVTVAAGATTLKDAGQSCSRIEYHGNNRPYCSRNLGSIRQCHR